MWIVKLKATVVAVSALVFVGGAASTAAVWERARPSTYRLDAATTNPLAPSPAAVPASSNPRGQSKLRQIRIQMGVFDLPPAVLQKLLAQSQGDQDQLAGLILKSGIAPFSFPSITTTDSESASITVSQKVPYAKGSFLGSSAAQTNYVTVGQTIFVDPHIIDAKSINTPIRVSDSEVLRSAVSDGGAPQIETTAFDVTRVLSNGAPQIVNIASKGKSSSVKVYMLTATIVDPATSPESRQER